MKLDDFPTAGIISGSTPLRNAAYKCVSFMRVAAAYSKDNTTPQAEHLAKFFQECADICREYIPKEEVEQTKKRGGK